MKKRFANVVKQSSYSRMIKQFIKDSAIYSIPVFISRGIAIFLLPLYTRILSPSDFGTLDMLVLFGSLVNLTVPLEVSLGVARYYPDEKSTGDKADYASTAFWFTVFCYTLFLFVCQAFPGVLSTLVIGIPGLENIFRLGTLYIWFNGLFYLVQNQFRWELRSINYAIANLLSVLSSAIAAVILAYALKWGLSGIFTGMVIGNAIGCLYGLWHLQHSFRMRFEVSKLKVMLAFSIPMVPSGITVFVSNYIDRLMINHFLSLGEVGLYGVGFRLASVVSIVVVGFQGALIPLVFKHYREKDTPRQLSVIFRIFIAFSLFIFLGLTIFSNEIIQIMATSAYYLAADVVIFLVPALLLSNMYIFAPGIGIAKKNYLTIWINLGGAIFCAGLSWFLIPMIGIEGAAISKLIGYGAIFCAYMIFSQRLYYIPHNWMLIVFSILIAVFLVILGRQAAFILNLSVLIKISFLLIFIVSVIMLGLVKKTELVQAIGLIQRRI